MIINLSKNNQLSHSICWFTAYPKTFLELHLF